jgi:mannose-6-phosphate isomerase-like protein (cupin superfamily)
MAQAGQTITDERTGTRILVHQTGRETAGRVLDLEVTYPAGQGRQGQQAHYHKTFLERFEVISGTATYWVAGQEHRASAGTCFEMPCGTAHLNPWNAGQDELRLHQTVTLEVPDARTLAAFEDFFETIFMLSNAGKLDARGNPPLLIGARLMHSLQPSSFAVGIPEIVQRVIFGTLAALARILGYRTHAEQRSSRKMVKA